MEELVCTHHVLTSLCDFHKRLYYEYMNGLLRDLYVFPAPCAAADAVNDLTAVNLIVAVPASAAAAFDGAFVAAAFADGDCLMDALLLQVIVSSHVACTH